MEILQLDGLEPQLFNLIGPLAMNPKVLRANNNYPFKTTERFQWYIAVEDNDVTGFVPVEQKSGGGGKEGGKKEMSLTTTMSITMIRKCWLNCWEQ